MRGLPSADVLADHIAAKVIGDYDDDLNVFVSARSKADVLEITVTNVETDESATYYLPLFSESDARKFVRLARGPDYHAEREAYWTALARTPRSFA